MSKVSLIVPPNYAMVESGVHRSGALKLENGSFLLSIRLKTIISLTSLDMVPSELRTFYEENNIRLITYDLGRGNRKHDTHTNRDI